MKKLSISNFDAVAFDMEGTLADTIPLHHTARLEAFKHHGFAHITREQHELGPTYGSATADIIGGILHAAGEIDNSEPFYKNPTVQEVIKTKTNLFRDSATEGFEAMPGAIAFIKQIAPHFSHKMALVTSSGEEFVHPFIQRYNLAQYFSPATTIGHETVIAEGLQPKPSGDPYTLAMHRLGSKSLLVFEDTVSGVKAAKLAHATVIALAFNKENAKLFKSGTLEHAPDRVVNSYEEAAKLLGI